MYCPNCGKQIKDGSSFCGFCGAQISEKGAPVNVQQSSYDFNEFRKLKKCFTAPFSDGELPLIVSVVVFAGMFLINWFTFFGIFKCGIGLTAIVLAGVYLLEYLDKSQMWDGKKATGQIAFRLVLPSAIMFLSGVFIRLYGHAVNQYTSSISVFGYSGSSSSSPDEGVLMVGVFLMFLSMIAFIMIETHGLHKNTTAFMYVKILIMTVIVVGSIVLISKVSIDSALGDLLDLF